MVENNVALETLAKIGKGTKRKKREINDLEVAEEINALYQKYKSLTRVAELIRLSSEMVRQIKSLTTLDSEVKKLFLTGALKGYDIGYRISKLQREEQILLARHIISKHLTSDDVRVIVKYKIDNPHIFIGKVINRVLQSKDKKIYVAYLGIEKNTFEKLLEKNKKKDKERIVRSIFNSIIPNEFITSFELNGRVVILKVLSDGLKKMRNKAKELGVPLAKLAEVLVNKYLEEHK